MARATLQEIVNQQAKCENMANGLFIEMESKLSDLDYHDLMLVKQSLTAKLEHYAELKFQEELNT